MTNEIIRETQLHMSTQHLCVWDNGIYMYIYDWNIEKFGEDYDEVVSD